MAFTGHHERTIDSKNRLQIPSQFRNAIDPERDGPGLYVILGVRRHSLSLVTEREFNELPDRIRTESMSDREALDFEQRFYSTASHLDMDKQGRVVLPEYLTSMVGIGGEVILAGAKHRIDIWRREDFRDLLAIDREHDWNWQRFLRSSRGPARAE